jgi:hypothetical protein
MDEEPEELPTVSPSYVDTPIPPWWESEWYREWEQLARRDYHGKIGG